MPEVYQQAVDQTLDALGVDKTAGLDFAEVLSRQSRYGKNVLPADEGVNWFKLILAQFVDIMVIILIVAAAISAILGEATDVIVILAIVALNAMLGIYQEYQAERALAALSRLQVPRVRVRRAGKVHEISAEELVPGDIVLIAEGDRIPADGRLIETINLEIEEAVLTGESLPVSKDATAIASDKTALGDRSNMAFMGTAVNYGRGEMLVTTTGLRTEIGNIAAMLLQVEAGVTPLQRRLNQLGRVLATGALIVVAIVFAVGFAVQGIPADQMFLIAISLAVAAVPEGLPALVTIGLSLGANRMVKRNALIRRLPAVETLGSVSVICSDKTGTLTRNEMTATFLVLPDHDEIKIQGSGYRPEGELTYLGTRDPDRRGTAVDVDQDEMVLRMLQAMALSTNAHLEAEASAGNRVKVVGDNTEAALLVAAQKAGLMRGRLEQDLPRLAELPFSSDRKAMTTIHEVSSDSAAQLFPGATYLAITKGAPDSLIEWARAEETPEGPKPMDEGRRREWQGRVDRMANDGLRVLGVACRSLSEIPEDLTPTIERELALLGLVGILDPARPEAAEAVRHAKEAGIRTIMITGDHALTAEAIARDLGILREDQKAITGAQLDAMSMEDLVLALESATCFARVSPVHKLTLVQSLQRTGNIVAMTGDGVNDAPALKQADIGVAMGITGADVSKGAAEMILTDDNFRSIVSAIEEGRAIYDNIKKFIKYLLSSNVGEILVMFVALLINLPIPLLAIQILWINLVTDGLPAIALGFEPAEAGVMQRRPRPINESIFAGGTGRHIIWVGILIAILTLGSYAWGYATIGLDARSPSLGLEKLQRSDIVALAGEAYVPEGWDSWGDEAQIAFLARRGGAAGSQFLEDELDLDMGDPGRELLNRVERIPRTIAFTVLAFTQMFEVMAIHAGDRSSFFRTGFKGNRLLFWAVVSTFLLQLMVVYLPFVQELFDTSALTLTQISVSFVAASVVLFAVELEKTVIRRELRSEESKILQSMS